MVTPFEVSQFEFRNLGIEKKMPFMPGIFFPEDQIEEEGRLSDVPHGNIRPTIE
jgi:hypothetical protein